MRFGMGYGLPSELMPLPSERAFGWAGWGGSIAIIDLDARMSIAYAMNRMFPEIIGDMRAANIIMAAYTSLATATAAAPVATPATARPGASSQMA